MQEQKEEDEGQAGEHSENDELNNNAAGIEELETRSDFSIKNCKKGRLIRLRSFKELRERGNQEREQALDSIKSSLDKNNTR